MRDGVGFENYGIEAGASFSRGYGNGVDVEFHGNDTSLVASPHLVCDVEHEGRVKAVAELHGEVHIVSVFVCHLFCPADAVGPVSGYSEGHESSADDVDQFHGVCHFFVACLVWHQRQAVFQSHAVVHGDGIVAGASVVQRGGSCHSREVRRAVDGADASFVVVQYDLRKVYVRDGPEHHGECP